MAKGLAKHVDAGWLTSAARKRVCLFAMGSHDVTVKVNAKTPAQNPARRSPPRSKQADDNGAVTVTYIVGSWLFLSEYFLFPAIRIKVYGPQDVIPDNLNSLKGLASRDCRGTVARDLSLVWLRLRQLTERRAAAYRALGRPRCAERLGRLAK